MVRGFKVIRLIAKVKAGDNIFVPTKDSRQGFGIALKKMFSMWYFTDSVMANQSYFFFTIFNTTFNGGSKEKLNINL